jgi:hypothetical protein
MNILDLFTLLFYMSVLGRTTVAKKYRKGEIFAKIRISLHLEYLYLTACQEIEFYTTRIQFIQNKLDNACLSMQYHVKCTDPRRI